MYKKCNTIRAFEVKSTHFDCIGLIFFYLNQLGIETKNSEKIININLYKEVFDKDLENIQQLIAKIDEIQSISPDQNLQIGDILMFYKKQYLHFAIVSKIASNTAYILHANAENLYIHEQILDVHLKKYLINIFRPVQNINGLYSTCQTKK